MANNSQDYVQDGDSVVLIANETDYLIAQVKQGKSNTLRIQKRMCNLGGLIGQPFGTTFEAVVTSEEGANKKRKRDANVFKLVPLSAERCEELTNLFQNIGEENDADNRNLIDNNTAQKLSAEEIAELKRKGDGTELLQALVENSASFQTKTVFSKEKYLMKKKKKHILIVKVLKPTARLICKAYFSKNDLRLLGLRVDSLAMLLTLSNVSAAITKKALVVEATSGLIVGSVMERLDGRGDIVNVFVEKPAPAIPFVQHFNFPKEFNSKIHSIPYDQLKAADVNAQPVEASNVGDVIDKYASAKNLLVVDSFDCVFIVVPYAPLAILEKVWPFLAPSRNFVIFHIYGQPLVECFNYLMTGGENGKRLAVDLELREIWFREHQVLPKRTHPQMWMHNASGYILSGIKILE